MIAFDDGGGAVEFAQARQEGFVRLRSALGDDDVGGPAQIGRRLAQCAAGQQVLVAEGRLTVNEHHVDAVAQALVLQAVIEEKNVAVEVPQGMQPALHAVLVDEDAHAGKILGQHVRFIPGATGIE